MEQAPPVDEGFPATDVKGGVRASGTYGGEEPVQILLEDLLPQPRAAGIEAVSTAKRALVVQDDPDRTGTDGSKSFHSR
jgi:hypothetical protein